MAKNSFGNGEKFDRYREEFSLIQRSGQKSGDECAHKKSSGLMSTDDSNISKTFFKRKATAEDAAAITCWQEQQWLLLQRVPIF
jgi:hypothetical protein